MTDPDEAARLELDRKITDLAAQHQLLMRQLYDAILTENDMPPWGNLDDETRSEIIEEATDYCDDIENDPRTWLEAQVEPFDGVTRLVAEQYDVAQRLREAETEMIAQYRPKRS